MLSDVGGNVNLSECCSNDVVVSMRNIRKPRGLKILYEKS